MVGGDGELAAAMDVASAPPEQQETRRGARRRPRADLRGLGNLLVVATPSLYVLALLIGPIVLIGLYSVNLASNLNGVPLEFDLTNWDSFLTGPDNPFRERLFESLLITLTVSVGAVLGAYPLAYFLAFVAGRHRYTILLLILAPFFTSYLLRVVAWQGILSNNGVVNSLLWELGLRDQGSSIDWLIFSNFSVGLVLFYAWVPFVALPIFVVLDNMDRDLISAAHDLGAGRWSTFWHVDAPAQPARGRVGVRVRARSRPPASSSRRCWSAGRRARCSATRSRRSSATRRTGTTARCWRWRSSRSCSCC